MGIARFDQNLNWAVVALNYVISRRSQVDIKRITSAVVHFFHHIEVAVSDVLVTLFGQDPAHSFAIGAESLLKTELGKIAMIAVQEVENMASGAEKKAAALDKILSEAKTRGLEVKTSLLNMLVELAVGRLKGLWGSPTAP